jgi:hypothetical protein
MTDQRPLILISVTAQHRHLVDAVGSRLAARGLALAVLSADDPTASASTERASEQCTLFGMVLDSTRRDPSPATQRHWQRALALGRPVVPLIAFRGARVPKELRLVQWVDLSRSFDEGWRDLLVLLDSPGIARYPQPSPPLFDPEVTLARVVSGRIPPDWSVTRPFRYVWWRFTGDAAFAGILMCLATLSLLLLEAFVGFGEVITESWPLFVGFALAAGGLTWYWWRSPVITPDLRGDLLVITPTDVLLHTSAGDVKGAFGELRSIEATPQSPDGSMALWMTPRSGQARFALTMTRRFGFAPQLAAEIVRAFRIYWQLRSPSNPSATPPAADDTAPLVFISYAHKDAITADLLELNLRLRGLRAWMDRSKLIGGQHWFTELQQANEQCDALLLVITPDAMRSPVVRAEYARALTLGKPVIGVLARTTRQVPPHVSALVQADYRGRAGIITGNMDVQLALDAAGVHPPHPSGHLVLDPALTLARAARPGKGRRAHHQGQPSPRRAQNHGGAVAGGDWHRACRRRKPAWHGWLVCGGARAADAGGLVGGPVDLVAEAQIPPARDYYDAARGGDLARAEPRHGRAGLRARARSANRGIVEPYHDRLPAATR